MNHAYVRLGKILGKKQKFLKKSFWDPKYGSEMPKLG